MSEDEEKEYESFQMRYIAYWGILAVETATIGFAWIWYFSTQFNRGNPPLSLSIRASHWGRSPVYRSPAEVQAWLNLKCMTTLYNYIQKGWNKLPTRRFALHEIQEGDFVPKKVLSVQPDSKGKWTPNYEGSCAMTFTTMDGGKLARPMKADAAKKYFVKKKLAKLKTRKGGLGKNERLDGLKTRKGGPCKN